MASTRLRSMRVPPELWNAAVARAKDEGTTVTALVQSMLKEYVEREPYESRHSERAS